VNVRLFISPAKNRCSSIPTNIRLTQGRSAQQSKPPNRSHCLINPLWDEAFFLTQTNLSSGMGVRVTHDMYHQSVHPKDGSIIQGGAGLPNCLWSSMHGAAPHGFTQGIFHILNRIYNCTKPGNWCVNHHAEKNLCTSYCTHYLFQLHILILQLHKLLSTAH